MSRTFKSGLYFGHIYDKETEGQHDYSKTIFWQPEYLYKPFLDRQNSLIKTKPKRDFDANKFTSFLKPKYSNGQSLNLTIKPFSLVKILNNRHFVYDGNICIQYRVELLYSEKGVKYHKYNLKPKQKYRWVYEKDLNV